MFDVQAWYARDYILGKISLPSKEEMKKDSQKWRDREEKLETDEDKIWFQGDYTKDLMEVTDYPTFDIEAVNKTFMLGGVMVASAAVAYMFANPIFMWAGFIGIIALSFIANRDKERSHIWAPLFSVAAGFSAGTASFVYGAVAGGVISQAIIITMSIFLLYFLRFLRIKKAKPTSNTSLLKIVFFENLRFPPPLTMVIFFSFLLLFNTFQSG